MTTRREFERRCWDALALYMTAATVQEFVAPLGDVDLDSMSEAEFVRFSAAYERVLAELDRRATRVTS